MHNAYYYNCASAVRSSKPAGLIFLSPAAGIMSLCPSRKSADTRDLRVQPLLAAPLVAPPLHAIIIAVAHTLLPRAQAALIVL